MLELNPSQRSRLHRPTAGLERDQAGELARDLAYLLRLWKVILRRIKKSQPHADLSRIGHDHPDHPRHLHLGDRYDLDRRALGLRASALQDFLRVVMPRFVNRLKLYDEKVPCSTSTASRTRSPRSSDGTCRCRKGLDRDRPDRSSRRHRRELGELPRGGRCRATAYEMNLRVAGDRLPVQTPRPGRRDRQRLSSTCAKSVIVAGSSVPFAMPSSAIAACTKVLPHRVRLSASSR